MFSSVLIFINIDQERSNQILPAMLSHHGSIQDSSRDQIFKRTEKINI